MAKCLKISLFISCVLAWCVISSPVPAKGSNPVDDTPNVENCKEVGKINVECYTKSNSEYQGLITVNAEYHGTAETCVRSKREIRNRCKAAYGIKESNLAYYYKYIIKGTTWDRYVPERSEWGQ